LNVPDGGWIALSVDDTGIGIAPEHHETIFDTFRQVSGSYAREHGGSGLGLSITLNLARMHGGFIWVESVEGAGSRFTILLPAPELAEAEALDIDDRPLIVLVDDDENTLTLLKDYLDPARYRVAAFTSAEQALAYAQAHTPDIVISDVLMPEMNGWELLTALRASAATLTVPVILLSVVEQRPQTAYLNVTHLQKPVARNILLDALQKALISQGSR
jgi:CheY-like chemotaxis protein